MIVISCSLRSKINHELMQEVLEMVDLSVDPKKVLSSFERALTACGMLVSQVMNNWNEGNNLCVY